MAVPLEAQDGGPVSHAVSRSSELLSCAKTALKIAKSQHANDDDYGGTMWWACQHPNELALCSWKDQGSNSQLDGLCEDGLSLLRTMDAELTQLESLVRRRGHTNDPTEEIGASVRRLETDAKELSSLVKTGFHFPRANAQYQRHTQLIANWLESVAQQQTTKLKEILDLRGNILADRQQRQKLLNPQRPKDQQQQQQQQHNPLGQNNNSTNGTSAAGRSSTSHHHAISETHHKRVTPRAMDTPLFNMAPLPKPGTNYHPTNNNNGSNGQPHHQNGISNSSTSAPTSGAVTTPQPSSTPLYGGNGRSTYGGGGPPSSLGATSAPATTASTSYGGGGYGGYGGATAASGYYGGTAAAATGGTGMRQRRPKSSSQYGGHYHQQQQQQQQERNEQEEMQAQIQMRQQQRQTENRLEEAQQAERTLSELGTMFSKMTNLITQQGEVLEKVEDDVEAGLAEVSAGQQEITKLYALKKGNRGLIIKLFSLLIFLIIFMRFYKR